MRTPHPVLKKANEVTEVHKLIKPRRGDRAQARALLSFYLGAGQGLSSASDINTTRHEDPPMCIIFEPFLVNPVLEPFLFGCSSHLHLCTAVEKPLWCEKVAAFQLSMAHASRRSPFERLVTKCII